ncbi:MAG: histidine phosphatase family protein, partial [Bacteroidota bacterium]
MKTIVLLRHGKSDWDADYGHDHDRPLAERGHKGARKMGRFLVTSGLTPDRALSSTALRARQTLAVAAEHGGWTGQATVTEALYGTTADGVIREIQKTPDDATVLVVVGHEPTFSGAVSRLIGGGRVEMKTATMARIDVDVETWSDVAPGRGVLAWLMPPGALKPNRYRKLQEAVEAAREAAEKAAEIATPDP